ncbi:hypothetical protein M3J09_001569 [Ascochyta lentis]
MNWRRRQRSPSLFASYASCTSRSKLHVVTQRCGTRSEWFSDNSRRPSQTSQRTPSQGPEPSYLTVAPAAQMTKSISKSQHFPITHKACLMATLSSEVQWYRLPTSNTPHGAIQLYVTAGWLISNRDDDYDGLVVT